MKRYCFALDLKDDHKLIDEYKLYHKKVWPEIETSIRESGINNLEIYLTGNRLFMIIEAEDTFSLEEKGKQDAANPTVQEWENLMWKYQQALPKSRPGEKWRLMEMIYSTKGVV